MLLIFIRHGEHMALAAAAAALTLVKVEALTFDASPIVGFMLPDEITLMRTCSRVFMPAERRIMLLWGIDPPPRLGWV